MESQFLRRAAFGIAILLACGPVQAQNYGPPMNEGAPQSGYSPMGPGYGPPGQSYGPGGPGYGAPPGVFGPGAYGPPPAAFGPPAGYQGYGQPGMPVPVAERAMPGGNGAAPIFQNAALQNAGYAPTPYGAAGYSQVQQYDPASGGAIEQGDPNQSYGDEVVEKGDPIDLAIAENRPAADHDPAVGFYVYQSLDTWRGIADLSGPNNNGTTTGANLGIVLPYLQDLGIGAQIGASYGLYDFNGRTASNTNEPQQQTFITAGLYSRADVGRPFSGGVVYDAMINNNFGLLGTSPYLSQMRGQLAYAVNAWNEVGAWGTTRDRGDTRFVGGAPVQYRAISQGNLFWRHQFGAGGADGRLWIGLPDRRRIGNSGGSLGEFLIGGQFQAPMTQSLALFANFQYMKPSSRLSSTGSLEDAFNLSIGLTFYPGRTAQSSTVAGRSSMPYMNVANNGSFLVDSVF
jgi:hypothetical protein